MSATIPMPSPWLGQSIEDAREGRASGSGNGKESWSESCGMTAHGRVLEGPSSGNRTRMSETGDAEGDLPMTEAHGYQKPCITGIVEEE